MDECLPGGINCLVHSKTVYTESTAVETQIWMEKKHAPTIWVAAEQSLTRR